MVCIGTQPGDDLVGNAASKLTKVWGSKAAVISMMVRELMRCKDHFSFEEGTQAGRQGVHNLNSIMKLSDSAILQRRLTIELNASCSVHEMDNRW